MFQKKPFLLSSIFFGKNNFHLFPFLLICFISQSVYSQTTETQKTSDAAILESGKPIERELAGQQKNVYQIKLYANQYVKVLIEQRGIDVKARLLGAEGKSLADFNAEARPNGTETIEFVSNADGTYKLEVSALYPLLPAGEYE